MKVLILGLVCIVWVQKACSAPKWSNASAPYDDLTDHYYEDGYCCMDCEWYDNPIYYFHRKDLDHRHVRLDGPLGFEDPAGDFNRDLGRAPYDMDAGLVNPGKDDRNSGSGASDGFSDPGTSPDDGKPDHDPIGLRNTDDGDDLEELLPTEEDGTGLPAWKRLALGLVAGIVLAGMLWKSVWEFVDRALGIPPTAGMERPVYYEPEFDVVWRLYRRDTDVDWETELFFIPNQSLTDLERTGRWWNDGAAEQQGRRVVPGRRTPPQRSNSLDEGISVAVGNAVDPVLMIPALADHSLENDWETTENLSVPGQPEANKQVGIKVLDLTPPKPTAPVGIPTEKHLESYLPQEILEMSEIPSLTRQPEREAKGEGIEVPDLTPPRVAASDGTPTEEEQESADLHQEKTGKSAAAPAIGRHPSATGHQHTAKSDLPGSISSAAQELEASPSDETPEKIVAADIGRKPPPDVPFERTRETPLENLFICSGESFQDDREGVVIDGSQEAGASGLDTTNGAKQERRQVFLCFKIPGVKSEASDRLKTWTSKIPCLSPQKDQEKLQKKDTKKKHWFLRMKFKLN